jgi:hypothetical protein
MPPVSGVGLASLRSYTNSPDAVFLLRRVDAAYAE